jgi:hypothetical protein
MTHDERIAWYQAQAAEARKMVADIDDGSWRYMMGKGNAPMKDVTDEMRAQQLAVANHMDELAQAWKRLHGPQE